METNELLVEFLDQRAALEAGQSLEFGRQGDVIVDDANPFLHRIVGRFSDRSGTWWIQNVGSRIPLVIVGENGARTELPPGGSAALFDGETRILFEAGSARYEVTCTSGRASQEGQQATGLRDGESTTDWGTIPLNFEQRQLLVALCEPRLTSIDRGIPSNKAMAARLGWSTKKLERKMDYLCQRFTEAGVVGLKGRSGSDAGERKRRLADHVLRLRIVGADDLLVLEVTDRT